MYFFSFIQQNPFYEVPSVDIEFYVFYEQDKRGRSSGHFAWLST